MSSLPSTSRFIEHKHGRTVGVTFHCDTTCLAEPCSFLAAEAWERMTFGGLRVEITPSFADLPYRLVRALLWGGQLRLLSIQQL